MRALSKEPNETLVMTTCKCRENNQNLVMTRTYFTEMLENKIASGVRQEQERIIQLLQEAKSEKLSPEEALSKGWKFSDPDGIWWLTQEGLISLIKGANND